MRPSVWSHYLEELSRLEEASQHDAAYHAACEGRTSLRFFNDWVHELLETGYLHNHTRMWLASVWIFTLQLPWQLGAAFMYRHLLDGDPASNTLSWRWVAGLHTPGKIYVARRDNIATYSDRRWTPKVGELELDPKPLPADGPYPISPLIEATDTPPPRGSIVLLHDDDLSADLSDQFSAQELNYVLFGAPRERQSTRVATHVAALRKDTATRSKAEIINTADELAAFTTRVEASTIHSMVPAIGFERLALMKLSRELEQRGVSITWHRRGWDASYMPLARSGFFPFWEKLRRELVRLSKSFFTSQSHIATGTPPDAERPNDD